MNRREVLVGSTAIAMLSGSPGLAWGKGQELPRTQMFRRAAVGGGGFVTGINMTPDGLTKCVKTDVGCANIWNNDTGTWDNAWTITSVPPPNNVMTLSGAVGAYEIVGSPSLSSRLYALTFKDWSPVTADTKNSNSLMRSDDRGRTWYQTNCQGYSCAGGSAAKYHGGPRMAVDPANPDCVYWGTNGGVIYRTLDGGIDGGAIVSDLLALLPTGTLATITPAAFANGYRIFTFSAPLPSILTGVGSWKLFHPTNITRPASTLNAARWDFKSANITTSTVITGTAVPGLVAASMSGDTVVWGGAPTILFDPSGGTTTVDGQIRTKNIYIGWDALVEGIYHSTDGGKTWSRVGKGGPSSIRDLAISTNGVLYATSNDYPDGYSAVTPWSAWSFNDPAHPSAWNQLSILTGNAFNTVAASPITAGKVVFVMNTGNLMASADYGVTWLSSGNNSTAKYSGNTSANPPQATWLANMNYGTALQVGMGMARFDPVVKDKLWMVYGRGISFCYPVFPPSRAPANVPFYIQSRGNEELLTQDILKIPGGPFFGVFQDIGVLKQPDADTFAVQNEPRQIFTTAAAANIQATQIVCAPDNPNLMLLSVAAAGSSSGVYKSTDQGGTWAPLSSQPVASSYYYNMAMASSTNWVVSVAYSPAIQPIRYTLDGSTWGIATFSSPGLTNGASFIAGGYLNNSKTLVADPINIGTFYAMCYPATQGEKPVNPWDYGQFWRSTDGGVTWSLMAAGKYLGTAYGFPFHWVYQPSAQAQLIAVRGFSGHLFFATGVAGGSTHYSGRMIRTVNGGSQWYEVASCPACVKVAAGAPKSGRNYPTLYAFGQFVIEGVRTGWCIARCDDATADPSQPLTWTFLSDAPAGELQSIASMSADPEVYGKFYIGASGIIIGESA